VFWHTALLEDISIILMAQVNEATPAAAFSFTSWWYATVKFFHWLDFIVTIYSHATNQLKWSENQKLIFSKVVWQQYTGEVDMSIIVVLRITSVYCVSNNVEIS